MTDRISGLFVILETDMREDDCAAVINAILEFRGVLRVETNVADPMQTVAEARVKADLMKKIGDVFQS